MDSQQCSLSPAPVTVELPKEILLHILQEYISLPSSVYILRALVLAKWIYQWILPKLYHSLSIVSRGSFRPERVGYDSLLCASPSSLALVRRLQCSFVNDNVAFWSFPNLTHLALWDSWSELWLNFQARAIAMLRLEELFVWQPGNLDTLSSVITDITPISRTLRRLCFYDQSIRFPNVTWTKRCRNLTHILVFCSSFQSLEGFLQTSLRISEPLQCFLVAPTWNFTPTPADIPGAVFSGDKRVALVLEKLKHFEEQGYPFWSRQRAMWKEVEERIAKNPHSKQVTVIDSFSFS
ncbi:hypothetical protein DL96DRAFT_1821526 [Flagelloscypha sp. PMI_526]|nr:hypothetical protein DL96DRAFT_1821526 [Flagelloscypha sp. PMI_526]